MVIKGTTIEGAEVTKTVTLQLGAAGAAGAQSAVNIDARKRLTDRGLQLNPPLDRPPACAAPC